MKRYHLTEMSIICEICTVKAEYRKTLSDCQNVLSSKCHSGKLRIINFVPVIIFAFLYL